MKAFIRPITLNETSYNAALLHKTLGVFGLAVSQNEVEQKKAGKDTLKKVRELQKQLNIPVNDSTLLNEDTIAAIGEALKKRGLTAASRSFTVSGTVRQQDGSVKKRQRLFVFDLDLRGIVIYQTVKTLSEIEKNKGFECVGQATTDNQGNYQITLYDWQYRRAERKKVDVVVYAIDDGREAAQIIGRSRLIHSEDYSEKGLVQGLDIVITQTDSRTEYERVMSPLVAFLKENKASLAEISASSEKLAFTASELDIMPARLGIAAAAERVMQREKGKLSHELLYGIGQQDILLDWPVLYKKPEEELRTAIMKSSEARIIRAFDEKEVTAFLGAIRERAIKELLERKLAGSDDTLDKILSGALPEEKQRVSFLNAIAGFERGSPRDFWSEYLPARPEFMEKPHLISGLLLTEQLTMMTGGHQPLVHELQTQRKLSTIDKLFDLSNDDWIEIIRKTGVPGFVEGQNEEEKIRDYAETMQNMLNAAFPTQRIARMVEKEELHIERNAVSNSVSTFLKENAGFDFSGSRIHDFDAGIEAAAEKQSAQFREVRSELLKLQRVFQVSSSPEAMAELLKNKLQSAYSIARIPRKSFIKTYSQALGGEATAFAIHQRAEHLAARAESSALRLMEYSHGYAPASVMGSAEYIAAIAELENKLPNYSELFGRPDICECEHCRSVYSAAAYFVELLRFLWRGEPNSNSETPLDLLTRRRPDLLRLPLTCENTNTIIPYIDLANEVMEYYTANDSLTAFRGYDTGKATAEELRANPQNFNLEAYRKLANAIPNEKHAVYPFTLPYHQPLDVIRTYSDHLKVSRYKVLKAMNPQPDAATANAIAAESLRISPEEYKVLTGAAFDGTADTTALHIYFGYPAAGDIEELSAAREFLRRSGVSYTELVELVKTRFINPHQGTLDFLEKIFAHGSLDAATIYARLVQIEAGTLDPATDGDIMAAINAYNGAHGTGITAGEFAQWVADHLGEFRQVITLYEPESKCDLENTKLRTLQSIYDGAATSGISNDRWSKIHRFIRLWRKLGWTIHETDLMLAAIGENDITTSAITKLESVSRLKTAAKLAPDLLAVAWGSIDAYGTKSLYRKLFLNKAVQQIDAAFEADAWGNYLSDGAEVLAGHEPAILAAFRMREEDLTAILGVACVVDGGNPRLIDFNSDTLNLANLSTIYRYVALAKALKMQIPELCKLIALFDVSPLGIWDVQLERFVNITPPNTYEFYQLASAVKKAGFKAAVVEYILKGALPPDSNIGLDKNRALVAAKTVRDAFSTIEQNHPETPASQLTAEILTAKLSLTYQPEIVTRFMGILDGAASFETITDANLNVVIPDDEAQDIIDQLIADGIFGIRDEAVEFLRALSRKYNYVKGSGRLTCAGVMSDTEREVLKGLANTNANFEDAVDILYAAPENFISANLGGILNDLAEANKKLLDHPAQVQPATIDEKLVYVYERYIPVLKRKLRRDAITRHIADLIGLSEAATAVLIAQDIDALVADLAREGFSANYFSDATWATSALAKTDETIDFNWGAAAPIPEVPADNFSVRWETYLAAPASGEYTLSVDVAEADEVFKLYLDDALILEKNGANAGTSWEAGATLNAARMHLLKLEFADISQNASVRLRWMKTTTAPEVVPSSVAYPFTTLESFVALATVYHRAAKFISGFALSEIELNHLIAFNADFGNIDFKALSANHWRRVNDYVTLRSAVPQARGLLTDVFAAANVTNPPPSGGDLKKLLFQASAWDEANLTFLVDTYFGYGVADFKNEVALNRLREVMQIVAKAGLSAQTVAKLGAADTDFDALNSAAQLIKNTVKAKYEAEDWLDLAGALSDAIRKNQQQALIGHLLTRPAIREWGAEDADGLFEYFLIDVQMGACMDTSRIVQANAAIQMFVNRCLLNLESDLSSGAEEGVSPGAIDKDRWEWMKNYRVWEANRKVFLYPENWLEPEWRNDRSEFFKELESYLVQNDITERSVEQGFRNYLASLNEVANLEVCGLHRENYPSGTLKYLHVFARTHNAPYKFFYRRWNEYQKWSAWERVPVDIRSVEDGADSGVHLIPVVWKKRLFLFCPEFIDAQEPPSGNSSKSVEEVSDDAMSSLEARKYWEIRLAWSEYVDGKWTPKQVTKEFIKQGIGTVIPRESRLRWIHLIDSNQRLWIVSHCEFDGVWIELGGFCLSDITSKVENVSTPKEQAYQDNGWPGYALAFMNYSRNSKLELADDDYLRNHFKHRLLVPPTKDNYVAKLEDPFFFSDPYRTYFVRPMTIAFLERLRNPNYFSPFLPGLLDTDILRLPGWPRPDPGDPRLPDLITREFDAGFPAENFPANGAGRQPVTLASAHPGSAGMPIARDMEAPSAGIPMSIIYAMETAYLEPAFGGIRTGVYAGGPISSVVRYDTGLEFHTFYHPFSGRYVTRLNQGGLSGLMESDTAIPSDDGSTFENAYDPNFEHGFVQKPSDFAKRTYYKENICFDVYGANSIYNWELFFHAPLYIATRLSKNGRFEEAMKWFHYIFDPTTDQMPGAGESETSRFWKVLPFKTTPAENLEDWFRSLSPNTNPNTENAIIGEWRDNPFDPHRVAANRPLAYMKHVVIKYVENLIAWGDSLFRQFSRESVNEALQIYVIANHILGPRPEFVPKRGEIKAETYDSLKHKWDDFSNALVELENVFPYSGEAGSSSSSTGPGLLGVGPALYFCIPANDKLIGYWDTVADRLYKIRHCQDIDGVERKLALFSPPIDPGALIQAASQGLSLGSILTDLSSPPPIHRFPFLIQKANEFCADVKALGSALLSSLEKIDAEELGRLRASHETQMLELMTAVRERQVLDAKAHKENLVKTRETAAFRLQHYIDLLGNDSVTPPPSPTLSATLTAESQLPADTAIAVIETDVDDAPTDSGESGVKIIPREKESLDKNEAAKWVTFGANIGDALAGIFSLFPQLDGEGTPLGVGLGAWWGGQNLGAATSALARAASGVANFLTQEAQQAATMASYIRREQDWTLQANLAAREIIQVDKQITSADIRIQVAEKELENHRRQIENAKEVELFLKDKFTNQELYQWMKEQLFAVYKQSYNLAFDMAKKAEKAYKFEMGTELASFIQYGYWDNSQQGLVAGEKLQLALRQMEKSYLEDNRRELELTKSISLARLNPLALIELRETGKCYLSVPEELFDLDYCGHYFRRIKSASLSIPCVAGPYTSVSCTLRLLNNSIRINTAMNSEGHYEHENDEGLWIDDSRFRTNYTPVTSIATSSAQSDTGTFEFNFRDERYLPFELAGAISEWQIELSTDKELRQFDYSTISDVILHFKYTARESGGLFKDEATAYIKNFLSNAADLIRQPLAQMFSMKHEFPTEWRKFMRPTAVGAEQILRFTPGKNRFPFLAQNRDVVIMKLEVLAKCTQATSYHTILSYFKLDDDPEIDAPVTSTQIIMPQNNAFGGLNKVTINVSDAGMKLEELDITKEMTLKLKRVAAPDFKGLATEPDEADNIFIVIHYKLN
jgi:hypothetical protein